MRSPHATRPPAPAAMARPAVLLAALGIVLTSCVPLIPSKCKTADCCHGGPSAVVITAMSSLDLDADTGVADSDAARLAPVLALTIAGEDGEVSTSVPLVANPDGTWSVPWDGVQVSVASLGRCDFGATMTFGLWFPSDWEDAPLLRPIDVRVGARRSGTDTIELWRGWDLALEWQGWIS
jgi:hypothetical protein